MPTGTFQDTISVTVCNTYTAAWDFYFELYAAHLHSI